jgi:hypothetical protein
MSLHFERVEPPVHSVSVPVRITDSPVFTKRYGSVSVRATEATVEAVDGKIQNVRLTLRRVRKDGSPGADTYTDDYFYPRKGYDEAPEWIDIIAELAYREVIAPSYLAHLAALGPKARP